MPQGFKVIDKYINNNPDFVARLGALWPSEGFRVGAHGWVAGSIPDQEAKGSQLMNVSLTCCWFSSFSPSLPSQVSK